MATRSNSSRERILSSAESIILRKGFSATSIDDILEKASITKSGFFYHFDGKAGLAEALVRRYLVQDTEIFTNLLAQADTLTEDPLHRVLIFLNLLADTMRHMQETHPGCLVASFTYESQHFNDDLRALMVEGLLNWRRMVIERLGSITAVYPMTSDVSIDTLADMFTAIIEGGIVLARNFDDNELLAGQILAYRTFLRMLFGAT